MEPAHVRVRDRLIERERERGRKKLINDRNEDEILFKEIRLFRPLVNALTLKVRPKVRIEKMNPRIFILLLQHSGWVKECTV